MLILNDLKTIDRSLVLLIVWFKSCAVIIAIDRQIDRIYLFSICSTDSWWLLWNIFKWFISSNPGCIILQEAKQSGLMLDRLSSAQQQLSHFGVRMPSVAEPVPPVRLRAAVLGGDAGIIELEKVGKVAGFTLESWKRWRFNWNSWNFGRNYQSELTIIYQLYPHMWWFNNCRSDA